MESQKRNNSKESISTFKDALFVDKEAVFALLLCQEGLLAPVSHLMNEEEMQEVDATGLYKGQSFPFSFILAPSGRRNTIVLKNAKKGNVITLVCEGNVCGELVVDSTFKIDKQQRLFKIMSGDIYSQKAQDIYRRLGDYAICGKYCLFLENTRFDFMCHIGKQTILQTKKNIQAENITAMVLDASPVTRIHERIFRLVLDESDLLVLMLLRHRDEGLLDFHIRKTCLQNVIDNYLPTNRILIFPLDDIYLFAGAHGIILDAILAQNLGCDRIVIGENHPNLTIYYDNQKIYSIFDTIKDIKIHVKLLHEFVYCSQCSTIVSLKTCPHGNHHHIHYHSGLLQGILQAGLIPPTILMRKEVSAKILSYLYPKRFSPLLKQFGAMFANNGMIEKQDDEDFYLKLINLYQTHSLK
ncbi:sulfate adenylyltransferase [Helicobacter turcicus]|uniref:Sulfate adenylyltransferase n=1 Tax=Helicobacter turcicus TaxID=2867412 RepID=A0ABS7JKM1_9HELI|nr:sulfate adenylyltransferase [Helicobacter turcicus]MBX7489949.1 sulfate adenylyltransferase [Helicobacter turcicus]MBX7544808.1 sulfate adenylyltransferase [Helicobacter turcicus]